MSPSGRSNATSSLDKSEIKVDTLAYGMWTIEATARDFASACGKDYMDNVATKSGRGIVRDGSVTEYKFGDQVTTDKPKPVINLLEPATPEPTRKHTCRRCSCCTPARSSSRAARRTAGSTRRRPTAST